MNYKINKLLFAFLLAMMIHATQDISAQIIELNGFTGIQLGGTAKLYDGDFRIRDAQNYGGKIAFGVSSTTFAELSYMRADTEGTFYPFFGFPSDPIRFSSNYFQVGGLQEVEFGRVSPFATVGMGVTWWSPKTSQLNSKVQFSATVGAGLKLWLTEMIGIRLQGSMLMPMVYNGFGFGCGIGTGGANCGSNIYTRVTPFQGEFSGGLIIRLSPN
ncbi:MAG: hypothetical protein ABFS38_06630 [Bacteroidota bacterium]